MFPAVSLAATTSNLHDVVGIIATYLNDAVGLLMGLAVVFFVYYVIKYFIQPNDQRAEAAQYVMWSLIGFFVILSFWGIVNILMGTFNLGGNTAPGQWSSFFNIFPK
jgi:hypothetical protein